MSNYQELDIAATFPADGVNVQEFLRAYVSSLESVGGLSNADARTYTAGTGVANGVLSGPSTTLFDAGTLRVGVDTDDPGSPTHQASITAAIAAQTGSTWSTRLYDELPQTGNKPGAMVYVDDGYITNSTWGVMSYWHAPTARWRTVENDGNTGRNFTYVPL